ncbi:MAG: hypothetical protein JXB07_19255 [Anaerolineae bacterium]|nr:hypothetical protein [Anaerolineae bacterium]
MFDTAFGFNGNHDFIEHAERDEKIMGLFHTGFGWMIVPEQYEPVLSPAVYFGVGAWYDEKAKTLEGMRLQVSLPRSKNGASPQRVLQKLGTPTHGFAKMEQTQQADLGFVSLMLVYANSGIAIEYISIPITIYWKGTIDEIDDTGRICLGSLGLPGNIAYHLEVDFVEPFVDLDNLSPMQQRLIGNPIALYRPPYKSFEDVFHLTLEEVTERAQRETDTCIEGIPSEG